AAFDLPFQGARRQRSGIGRRGASPAATSAHAALLSGAVSPSRFPPHDPHRVEQSRTRTAGGRGGGRWRRTGESMMSRAGPTTGDHALAPLLQVTYAPPDSLSRQLADERVLAVFGFGDDAPDGGQDPRWLRVPLQPLPGTAPWIEIWRASAPVRAGRVDGVAWASDGELLFGALEIDEGDAGIGAAAASAYARLTATLAVH